MIQQEIDRINRDFEYRHVPPAVKVPDLITGGRPVSEWIKPVSGESLRFKTTGVGKPNDVEVIPFYDLDNQHYTVYWNVYENEQQRQEAIKIAKQEAQEEQEDEDY